MFITKKHLPRRTFLRGMGATLALPLLDSMVPARTLLAQTAANPAARLGFVYVPHGAIMDKWTPATEGAGFEFTPILKPLEPFRDYVNVVSGLGHRAADTTAVHSLSPTTWLSGVRPKATQGVDAYAGITADQIAAQADRAGHAAAVDGARHRGSLGPDRLVRSRLRLHLHEHAVVADADDAAADGDQPAQGVRADVRPGRQRRRSAWRASRKTAASSTRSPQQTDELQRSLGRRIATRERVSRERARDRAPHPARPRKQQRRRRSSCRRAPAGVPFDFEEHVRLMYDLMALAYQANITRVFTFMVSREVSNRTYPQVGVTTAITRSRTTRTGRRRWRRTSGSRPTTSACSREFLDEAEHDQDGDGTLLDHSLILYGSNMSNSNAHDHFPLPNLVVGGATGRHQRRPPPASTRITRR